MSLEEDLAAVEDDLRAKRLEAVRIGARIEGLVAQRDALMAAIQQTVSTATAASDLELALGTKDRAIIEILRRSAAPMRIPDIVRGLNAVGRSETYNGISVYLDNLLKQGRVERVSRGLYSVPR
jgi:hypothetical protein